MKPRNKNKKTDLVIIGTGGHAVSVANIALASGHRINCFVDERKNNLKLLNYKIISNIEQLENFEDFYYAIAVGDNFIRENLFVEMSNKYPNLNFPILIHPTATISLFVNIDKGTIVMPKSFIGPNSNVGKFCLINTQASIDHDCNMLDFSSLAPAVVTGGNVEIGIRSAISIGAVIKNNIKIGNDSVVGANSYLNIDLPNNKVSYGSPAKQIRDRFIGEKYLS
jgi:sugar O-acyltransferase (sialic acid O-acetyltransferase NeuD family)